MFSFGAPLGGVVGGEAKKVENPARSIGVLAVYFAEVVCLKMDGLSA